MCSLSPFQKPISQNVSHKQTHTSKPTNCCHTHRQNPSRHRARERLLKVIMYRVCLRVAYYSMMCQTHNTLSPECEHKKRLTHADAAAAAARGQLACCRESPPPPYSAHTTSHIIHVFACVCVCVCTCHSRVDKF